MLAVKRLLNFVANIYRHREMIRIMALRELSARYVGTLGGMAWFVVHPVMVVLIYWFVFDMGFKVQVPGGIAFVPYFVCGLVPWLFFNEVLMASTNAIVGNAHLVKKVVFPTEVLPIVYLVASACTHLILIMIAVGVSSIYGSFPSLHILGLLYYFGLMSLFVIGLGWILAALQALHRDVLQVMNVVISLWFWLTPIVWVQDMIPEHWRWIPRLNPMTYIVEGYRDAILYHRPIWSDPKGAIYVIAVAIVFFVVGATVFRRLKAEFADVL